MSPQPRSLAPRLALLQEQRYRRHFLREDGRQTAIVMAVVAVAYTLSARNDFLVLGGALLFVSLASRGLLVVAIGVALVLLRRAKRPSQQDRAGSLALFATAIFVSAVHLGKIPSGQIHGPLIATGALLCVLYFAQRGPIYPRAVVGCVLGVGGVVLVFVSDPQEIQRPARLSTFVALVALNVVGVFSARSFEEQRRRRFEAERRERHARQQLTANLRELAVEKERAEAMSRARAAFLAAMSHEFRTPMNAVIGLSDLLLDAPLAPDHRKNVRTISDSARALLAMLNDILDFAKIDAQNISLSPAPFDLRRLATSVVDMLHPQARARSIELTLDLSPDVPGYVLGDDARLRQVLVNLVSNAIKFTDRGSVTLQITARAPVARSGSDHAIAFRVEDTGIGMAPELMARLFRPFEQADKGIAQRHSGTGLGLAISKQIVLAMGGDIHVESEVGRGSVFSFTLQLAAASPPAPVVFTRLEDPPPLAILVVDDNDINRDVARGGLARLGYSVDLENDGQAAIEAVSRKDYDVVFMDLRMPGMSGIEATARIGERLAGKRAPHIIAMTASVFEEDREACRRAGMCDFVGKPIDLAQVHAVLCRVAEERGASTSRAAAGATLARERLAKLRQIETFGEPHFLANLCQLFLASLEERLSRMREALGRGDARALEDEAHILKSSSATLGATHMSELCGRVEGAAHEGRIEEIRAILDALLAERRTVERALTQEIQGELFQQTAEAS